MTNSKKSEMVTILYFVTFIVALFSNINMIAEAPVKLYNYVVTVLFLLAKMWFCISMEKNKYSVWINLATFLAAVFVLIFSDNIDNGFALLYSFFKTNEWFDGDFFILTDDKYSILSDFLHQT